MTSCKPASENFNHSANVEDKGFSYSELESETRIVVQQRTSEIKTLVKRNAQDVLDIGQKLIEVKQKLRHGNFRHWLKFEFQWSISAAAKFMQVAENFKSVNFTHLEIAASALYLLAAPSTSEEARTEALELASQGENITYSKANAITNKHKPKPVTINATAETVERVSSTPIEVLPVTHNWQPEADQEFESPGDEDEYWKVASPEPEIGDNPLIQEGAADSGKNKVPHPREESCHPFQPNSEQRRTLSEIQRDHNGMAEMDASPARHRFTASRVFTEANDYELPTAAVDAALACMREIDRLNTTFPSAGFYLGIQLEGSSRFIDDVAHPLGDIFSVKYLREAVVLEKKATCPEEHSAIQYFPDYPAIATP